MKLKNGILHSVSAALIVTTALSTVALGGCSSATPEDKLANEDEARASGTITLTGVPGYRNILVHVSPVPPLVNNIRWFRYDVTKTKLDGTVEHESLKLSDKDIYTYTDATKKKTYLHTSDGTLLHLGDTHHSPNDVETAVFTTPDGATVTATGKGLDRVMGAFSKWDAGPIQPRETVIVIVIAVSIVAIAGGIIAYFWHKSDNCQAIVKTNSDNCSQPPCSFSSGDEDSIKAKISAANGGTAFTGGVADCKTLCLCPPEHQ